MRRKLLNFVNYLNLNILSSIFCNFLTFWLVFIFFMLIIFIIIIFSFSFNFSLVIFNVSNKLL